MKSHSSRTQEQPVSERASMRDTHAGRAQQRAREGLPRAFRSLRHRNFRLYWSGQIISLMGTYMQSIGQAWLVLELTHSAWQLGLVGALQFLPVLLFSIFGGVFADRWPKRRVLLVTQTLAMLQALLLWTLIATGVIQLWQIYGLAILLGCTSSLDMPTRSAFVVEMVGREDLPNAVALNSSLANLARVVGPGLGGLIIAASGVTMLFLLNALSFLAVIAGLALINGGELHAQARQHIDSNSRQKTWQSLHEGMAYIWQTPAIVLILLVVGLVLFLGANFNVVLPLFASDVLHTGASGFGLLSASSGIGSLGAALWLAWSNQRPTIRKILLGTLIFSLLEIFFAISHLYLLSLVLIAGVGVAETTFGALAVTALQTVAPDHLRGRVMSAYILFFTGSVPLGYVLAGWLSALCGVSTGLFLCDLLCLMIVGAGWMWRRAAEQNLAQATRL